MRSQLLHSTWFLISTQFLITTYLQQHLISWFPWFTWYSCSVLNTFSLVHATDMQSIVELVWSFFYPTHLNQIDPLWQPLICHSKHLWQSLILVWHLLFLHQHYPQIVICFCPTEHFWYQCHTNRNCLRNWIYTMPQGLRILWKVCGLF